MYNLEEKQRLQKIQKGLNEVGFFRKEFIVEDKRKGQAVGHDRPTRWGKKVEIQTQAGILVIRVFCRASESGVEAKAQVSMKENIGTNIEFESKTKFSKLSLSIREEEGIELFDVEYRASVKVNPYLLGDILEEKIQLFERKAESDLERERRYAFYNHIAKDNEGQ